MICVIMGVIGFISGMYVASQIEKDINKKIKK